MDCYPEVSDSPLAWSWVIEALASFREVDMDLICDLIETTPNLSDNLGEEARERVALRNLEALYDPAKVLNNGDSVSSDQEEIQFDSSECFTRVLERVMDQTSVSSVRKDGADPLPNVRKVASDKLMREVHAFIEKKKDCLPKCALQELCEILQNGNICPETDLKRDKSCSQTQKRRQDCQVDVQSGKLPPEKKRRHDSNGLVASPEKNSAPLISSDMQDCPVGAQSGKSSPGKKLRHDSNGSIASADQNSAPLTSSGMQDGPVDVQGDKSPPGKKLRHDDDSNGSIASTYQNPAPLVPLLTWWPCDVSSEDEKRHAEKSSTPADSPELDVCVKCNEGGEMLICSVSSCPVVVHERCLGFSESVDNRDDFLCPFCSCISAKSEYAEAKEKMILARENLCLFVGGNPVHQSKGFPNANANSPRQGSDERLFKGKGVYQVDRASTDTQHKGHLARDNVHTSPPNCSSKEKGEEMTVKNCQLEKGLTNVNANSPTQGRDERPFKGNGVYEVDLASTDKQHIGHLAQDNVYTSPPNCSSKEGEDMTAKNCQLEEGFTNVNTNPPRQGSGERLVRRKGVDQVDRVSTDKQHKGHLARDNVHTSPPNCSSKEVEDIEVKYQPEKGKQMMPIEHFKYTPCASSGDLPETENHAANSSDNNMSPLSQPNLVDQMKGASSASLDDCDGISEEENCRAPTSKYSPRAEGVSPARKLNRQMPRNRVPWTEEEVEMLKNGMKRFGGDMKVIPWTTILDFGSSVFWKGRTGGDLKDKWRNMIKANPNLR